MNVKFEINYCFFRRDSFSPTKRQERQQAERRAACVQRVALRVPEPAEGSAGPQQTRRGPVKQAPAPR